MTSPSSPDSAALEAALEDARHAELGGAQGADLPLPGEGGGWLSALSRGLLRAEIALASGLVAAILLVLLANVITRAIARPLIWSDELAVQMMVWLAFIGASIAVATRRHMSMGLLPSALGPRARLLITLASDALVLVFLLVMGGIIWGWLDLPGLRAAGSIEAYEAATFNFVWSDPTQTLGLRMMWFWLIMPISTLCAIIHALAALQVDLAALRAEVRA